VGITAGSREVPGRNACGRRQPYCIIIIIIIIIIWSPPGRRKQGRPKPTWVGLED